MRTFRLLVWLRWRIGMNTTTRRGRWASIAITVVLALAMSPIYVGGAIGAYALAVKAGAQALPIVFGVCQLSVFWVSLLIGAMGRTFELDKLKRYPLRSRDVFATNAIASLGEPLVVITVPSLVAAAIGVAHHSGAPAGLAAAAGAGLLLLVTASLLQLLLAILDDLLRREWMRYVAAFFFTMTVISFQLVMRSSGRQLAAQAEKAGFTPDRLLEQARLVFEQLPTASAPASVGGAHPAGWLASPFAGLALCLAMILVPLALGARVMATAALRAGIGGRVRAARGKSSAGSFASRLPFLSRSASLLVARELRYVTRTPALLYQLAVVPLTSIVIMVVSPTTRAGVSAGPYLPMFVMLGTLAGRNLMMWGYDGPGIRTLFLLPVSSRDLILSKNIGWFTFALLEAAFIFTALVVLRGQPVLQHLGLVVTGWLAMLLASALFGTWISASHPTRPPERGLGRRSPGGLVGVGAVFVMLALAGALVLAVFAVRALTPDRYDELASQLVVTLAAGVAAGAWWIGLERNADTLERCREKMIDTLAKSSDA